MLQKKFFVRGKDLVQFVEKGKGKPAADADGDEGLGPTDWRAYI